jgi:hypothetical protein
VVFKNLNIKNKILLLKLFTTQIEVITFVIIFSFFGSLYFIFPDPVEENDKCKKICSDKGYVYIPRVLSGLDTLGRGPIVSADCFCSEKKN